MDSWFGFDPAQFGLRRTLHVSAIDTKTERTNPRAAQPMMRKPSPGDPWLPFATKFGSGGIAKVPTEKPSKVPSKGPSTKIVAALATFMSISTFRHKWSHETKARRKAPYADESGIWDNKLL